MPAMTVVLTALQLKSLKEHADKKKREPGEDLVQVWWGRVRALDDYAEKLSRKNAKFRVYKNHHPKPAPLAQKAATKEAAKKGRKIKPGKDAPRQIALLDGEGVALYKAKLLSSMGLGSVVEILKKAGRNKLGVLGKKS